MNLLGRYGTTRRVIRLIHLLQTQSRGLAELEVELSVGPLQLGRDLDLLREEGFPVREQGEPATFWIERGRAAARAEDARTGGGT